MRTVAVALFVVAGCVDTSTDRIQLTAEVTSASVSVEEALLVTQLSGDFSLRLRRGDFADGDSVIESPPSIVLVRADSGGEVLPVDAVADTELPWVVAPDSQLSIRFTLSDENLLDETELDAVCSGAVLLSGSVQDANNRSEPIGFESEPVTAQGCP